MKKETRQKTIDYDVFISFDGKEFEKEQDCIHHEKILTGERKLCSDCEGTGTVFVTEEFEDHHTGVMRSLEGKTKCKTCGGKGYLEKKTITNTIWV